MKQMLLSAVCLLCLPFLGGCVLPYCAYPTLDYTPSVKLERTTDQVRAFRVDIDRPTADMSVFVGPVYERLSEVPVTDTDDIPAQVRPSLSYGLVVLGIALNYLTHTSHSVALRIYRPGYELVEVKSWEAVNKVVWRLAPDLAGQQHALDALLPLGRLEPGSPSAAHREILLFGASEYERLASMAQSQDHQAGLRAKARQLRDRAKE